MNSLILLYCVCSAVPIFKAKYLAIFIIVLYLWARYNNYTDYFNEAKKPINVESLKNN